MKTTEELIEEYKELAEKKNILKARNHVLKKALNHKIEVLDKINAAAEAQQ